MTGPFAAKLAPQIAAIDPWHRLGIQSAIINKMLSRSSPEHLRRAITMKDQPIGAIVVHLDWLLGPYLKHLSILPTAQGQGAGTAALHWLVTLARERQQPNLWLCVSGFNHEAQQFYQKNSFEIVGTIDDLVKTGETEILMRRRLDN